MIDKASTWEVQNYQSGSTLLTNGDVAIYIHHIPGRQPADDASNDARRLEYAKWIAGVLNRSIQVGKNEE